MDYKNSIKRNRDAIRPQWTDLQRIKTDRSLQLERPPLFKTVENPISKIPLTTDFSSIEVMSLQEAIHKRRSLRSYSNQNVTFEELSYLLYETSSVTEVKNNVVFRTIPTGGATNAMETYVYVNRVEKLSKGLYLYLQNEHSLVLIRDDEDLENLVNDAILHQLRNANMVVFFTTVPYRSEYKYAHCAHKMLMIEAGHAGQNLSLCSEAINAGAVCIAAYNQELCDELLQLDIDEEFTSYVVALGKRG